MKEKINSDTKVEMQYIYIYHQKLREKEREK